MSTTRHDTKCETGATLGAQMCEQQPCGGSYTDYLVLPTNNKQAPRHPRCTHSCLPVLERRRPRHRVCKDERTACCSLCILRQAQVVQSLQRR